VRLPFLQLECGTFLLTWVWDLSQSGPLASNFQLASISKMSNASFDLQKCSLSSMAHGDDYDRNNSKLWRLLGTGKLQGRHVHRDSEVGTETHELPRSSDFQDRSYKGLLIRMAE
jgi:hypothetical protein